MKNKIKINKRRQKIAENWIKNHGAATFDFKNENIILYDGGLFWIEPVKYKAYKVMGHKKITEGPHKGCSQVIFSKKPILNRVRYDAYLWISEINETISYLKSMKRMLNKIGFKTGMG